MITKKKNVSLKNGHNSNGSVSVKSKGIKRITASVNSSSTGHDDTLDSKELLKIFKVAKWVYPFSLGSVRMNQAGFPCCGALNLY